MAVSAIQTYKSLNLWQRTMGEDIWRFNQVSGLGSFARKTGRSVYVQPERDEIAQALSTGIQVLLGYLGYYPRPVYTSEQLSFGNGVPFQLQTLTTRYKHVEAFGQRATTLIAADVSVSYSASNPVNGFDDTATITVGTTDSASEIQVFFRVADGAPEAAFDLYQIEPLKVTVNAGVATITGKRALFVRPDTIWDTPYIFDNGNLNEKNAADTLDPLDFVTKVDVYRVYTDTTQAFVVSDNAYSGGLGDASSTYTAAAVRLVDNELGIFQPRVDFCCLGCGVGTPQTLNIYYKAGLPLFNGDVQSWMAEAVARMANAVMAQEICTLWNQVLNRWSTDRDAIPRDLLQPNDLANPFGLKTGQVEVWRNIRSKAIGQGSKLGAR